MKVIDEEFVNWLIAIAYSDVIPQDEYLLRSAMLQFAHYIKGLYNIRFNQTEIMENIQVLKKELSLDFENPEESYHKVRQTLEDLNSLTKSLEYMQKLLQVKIWQKRIEATFPEARVDSDDYSFGILINGIYCGVWADTNDKYRPFWGFYFDKQNYRMPEGGEAMMQEIIEKAGLTSLDPVHNYLKWNYTTDEFEPIVNLFLAAKDLGYELQPSSTNKI